jgi:hypothetical protein
MLALAALVCARFQTSVIGLPWLPNLTPLAGAFDAKLVTDPMEAVFFAGSSAAE